MQVVNGYKVSPIEASQARKCLEWLPCAVNLKREFQESLLNNAEAPADDDATSATHLVAVKKGDHDDVVAMILYRQIAPIPCLSP